MATKTKAELEQEIADNHNQIAALKQELEKSKSYRKQESVCHRAVRNVTVLCDCRFQSGTGLGADQNSYQQCHRQTGLILRR